MMFKTNISTNNINNFMLNVINVFVVSMVCFFSTQSNASDIYNVNIYNKDSVIIIDYKFLTPVKSINFIRKNERDHWGIDKIFKHDNHDGLDVFNRIDGESFSKIRFYIPVSYQLSSDWYDQIKIFSDGSRELYTGYLKLEGLESVNHIKNELTGVYNLYDLASGSSIAIDGHIGKRKIENIRFENDTYIFFGDIDPILSDTVNLFVDPSFSADSFDYLNHLIFNVFNEYKTLFHHALSEKVTIFLTYENKSDPVDVTGEVTGYQVNLNISGHLTDESVHNIKVIRLISHELFHLFNATEFKHLGPAWIHEGSAEYFSNYILLKLGEIKSTQYNRTIEESINTCASRIGQYSISDSDKQNDSDMIYYCGALVFYSIDKYYGLGTSAIIWSDLLNHISHDGSGEYDEASMFYSIRSIVKSGKFFNILSNFISNKNNIETFYSDLRMFGWDLTRAPIAESDNFIFLSFNMLNDMLISDCPVSYSFSMNDGKFYIKNASGCKQFKTGEIVSLDGHKIGTYKLYNEMKEKCINGHNIKVSMPEGKAYEVKCHAKLKDVVPYFTLHN